MKQLKIMKQFTIRDTQSFAKYLSEVSGIPMLSEQEEIELSKRIKKGDRRAINKLVCANLRFVISVAKQYKTSIPLQDLVQEGNAGLIKAAEKFDESRGFKFISYAVWWIRQSILQHIADHQRQIRLPINKGSVLSSVKYAISELEKMNERTPDACEISNYLMEIELRKPNGYPQKFTENKINEILIQSQDVLSFDVPITHEDEHSSMVDIMQGDGEYDVDDYLKNKDLKLMFDRVMKNFPKREREVIILHFGLFDKKPMTLDEIGVKFDLTRERVRQIKEKALRMFRRRSNIVALKEYI